MPGENLSFKKGGDDLGHTLYKRGFLGLDFERLLLYSISYILCIFIISPVVIPLINSFKIEAWGKETVYTVNNYLSCFSNPRILSAILNTLWISTGTTLFATIVGCSLAWLVARTDMPLRKTFEMLNTIPIFLSPFVGAIAWMYLAAPRAGFLNKLALKWFGVQPFNIYGLFGVIWVTGIFFTPIVFLLTIGALKRMDPSLEESSRGCGAGIISTTCRVTLPLVSPAILSAVILVFVSSAGEFGVPLTLGVPYQVETLVTIVFEFLQRENPDYNSAAAVGSILLVLTIFLTYLAKRIVAGASYTTVTGKGYRPSVIPLRRWKYLGLAWNSLYFVVAIFLPIFILFVASLHKFWYGMINLSKLNFYNYYELLFVDKYAVQGFKNSLFLAVVGATVAMCVSTLTSYFIYRTRSYGRSWVEYIANLPVGIPGIVMAMGFLLIFIRTPIYATIWILMVSYIIRFIPYGIRSVSSVLLSLSPELDESSRGCGASFFKTIKNITLPLLKPGFVAGWLLLFIIFFREFPISMLLWSSGNQVMSVAMWYLLEHKTPGLTGGFAIMQIAVIFIAMFIIQKTLGRSDIEM